MKNKPLIDVNIQLIWFFIFLILLNLSFLIGRYSNAGDLLVYLLISVFGAFALTRTLRPVALLFFIFLIDYTISSNIIDFSSDGLSYHYEAARRIANSQFFNSSGDIRIDTNPALPWLIEAIPLVIMDYGGLKPPVSLNSFGKIGFALLLFRYIFVLMAPMPGLRLWLSLVVAFPPIFLSQFLTGYQDYYTYVCAAFLAFSAYSVVTYGPGRESVRILILSFCLGAVMKIQSLYFVGLAFPVLVFFLSKEIGSILREVRKDKIFLSIVFLFLCLTLIIYFSRNYFTYGGLLPVASAIGTSNILLDSEFYKNAPPWSHFLHSIFSAPVLNTDHHSLSLGIPSLKELPLYGHPDLRHGAYGPGIGLILLTLLVLCVRELKNRYWIVILYVILFILIAPGVGTARYYPFLQLLCPLMLLVVKKRYYSVPLAKLLVVSYLFVAIGSLTSYVRNYYEYHLFARELSAIKPVVVFRGWYYHKLVLEKEFGVRFHEYDILPKSGCESIRVRFPRAPVHDEILLCDS